MNFHDYIQKYIHTWNLDEIPNPTQFSYGHIHTTHVFIGKNPKSLKYGKIIGFFTVNQQNYRFTFHVHQPKQKNPHFSNHMNGVKKLTQKSLYGIPYIEEETTNFGLLALRFHVHPHHLKKDMDSFALKQIANKLIQYSREQNLCKYFRKHDKQSILYKILK